MYNPSRGGVRGGADQFTWESVKGDKHRENYLGHSLMAPVGRWQKGKDLSWYAKGRKDSDKGEKSELASIKRAEEEAMLIALGHNIVKKTETLSKEDMHEALKRNASERDSHNIERIDGLGASSQRFALLSGAAKDSRQKSEGVAFDCYRDRNVDTGNKNIMSDETWHEDRSKSKKKSKKHKKEKKHKHNKELYDSDSSNSSLKHQKRDRKSEQDTDGRKLSKLKHKKSLHRHKNYSSNDSEKRHHSNYHPRDHKRHKKQSDSVKRRRHDSSDSE